MVKITGFTLIEMMVVVSLLSIIGIIATTSLFSTLRGATKTELLKEIKQNGDYALSIMEVKIRNNLITNADCGGPATTVRLLDTAGNQTIYACVANSGVNRLQQQFIPVSGTPLVNYLTNTSVTIPACDTLNIAFTCTNSATLQKTLTIDFRLQQTSTVSAAEAVSQLFQHQIDLRNN